MTNLFLGLDRKSKTDKLIEISKEYLKEGKKVFYYVPDQICLEMERYCFEKMKDINSSLFEVLNFSRTPDRFYKDMGKRPDKPYIDEGGKKLILSLAVKEISDRLSYFGKNSGKYILSQLFDTVKLLKQNKIDGGKLMNFFENSSNIKIKEIAEIYESYNSILSMSYYDSTDELERLTNVIDASFFRDKVFVFDFFNGFSKIENDFIKIVIENAKEVYFSFTCDNINYNYKKSDKFYPVYETIEKVIRFSKEAKKEIKLNKDYMKNDCPPGKLAENIFSGVKEESDDNIKIISCENSYDECEFISLEIKRLLRENRYRYSDFAVVARDDSYKKTLEMVFDRYRIPFFNDNKVPYVSKPIYLYINSIFEIMIKGFTKENIIKLLKTDLTGYSFEECCIVENYLNLWNISSKEFCGEDFKYHPRGFVENFTEKDIKELETVNKIKSEFFLDISSLKEDISSENAVNISKTLYNFLLRSNIPDYIQEKVSEYEKAGFIDLAEEYTQVFNLTISIFEQISMILDNKPVSIREYYEYFSIVASDYEIGKIPTSLDEVFYGSAEKVKTMNKKCVFIIGMNQGVFPKNFSNSSLISDFEIEYLKESGFDLGDNDKEKTFKEKFLFVDALLLSEEKLYITYPQVTIQGEKLLRSPYVNSVIDNYENLNIIDTSALPREFRIQDEKSACVNIGMIDKKIISKEHKAVIEKKNTINKAEKFDISGKLDVKSDAFTLNEKDLIFSASQYETYVKCPFSYFMRYVMKVDPMPDTNFGQRVIGNFVHNGLEYFFKSIKSENLSIRKLSDENIDKILRDFFDYYSKKVLYLNESVRSAFLYESIISILKKIVYNLKEEFSQSLFEPVEFELKIGDGCSIKPLEVKLDNGKNLKFIGSVDRVDEFKKDGTSYIRIVDYKTGTKEFKLKDVYNGINIQMLIYLFSIWNNSNKENIPAGILYYPAKTKQIVLDADSTGEDVQNEIRKNFKRNGLLLNDEEVLLAMENPLSGKYIPIKVSSSGKMSGQSSLADLSQMGELEEYIIKNMKKTGNSIINGDISISPLKSVDPCQYCDYMGICAYDERYCSSRYYKDPGDNVFQKMREERGGE